jgi:hypothetical protein
VQLRLDANPLRPVPARAKQLNRWIDVRRALDVDPDEVVPLLRAIDEPIEIALADVA